jgi:hypothetical protein
MQKKVDATFQLAARTIQSQPWDLSHWWKTLVFGAVRVKHECCFRDWGEPYPGTVGDRASFICGECSQRGPIERVPDPVFGAEGAREAFDLGFCPLDPFCSGERLKPVSCASVFADEVNRFCDELGKVLAKDRRGRISWQKAQEAYWAFSHFRQHLPDWDPTGAYDGAFDRWQEDCAREGLTPWGPGGRPEPVPLIKRILQEQEEALAGAQRAYQKIMAPAERVLQQALSEARRVEGEARMKLYHHQSQEIQRLLSGRKKVNRRLAEEEWAAQWAAQMKSNREHGERYPDLSSRPWHSRGARDSEDQLAPQRPTDPPPPALSNEAAALIHLQATIRRAYEKSEAAAYRAYDKAVARAERAYEKAMGRLRPVSGESTREEAWGTLVQLAYRLTDLGRRVDQAIGVFRTIDVTEPKDATAGLKRSVRRTLGLPAKRPPGARRGPRPDNLKRHKQVLGLAKGSLPVKQIAHMTGTNYHTARRWILQSRRLLD